MRLKLSTHFTLLILLVGALTLLQDPRVGAAYLIASAAILVPLSMWRVPRRYFYVVLFSAVAIWLTHFLRVPFLLALPESARFPRVVILTPALGVRVLLQIALYSLLLLLGLVMGLRAFAGRTPVRSEVEKHGRRPYLLHASIVVLVLCVGLLMIRVLFQLGLGLNTKFVVNPSTGFLSRILPDHLIYPVALLYLVKYRRHISSFETSLFALVVVGFSILVTLSGSRQAFAAIGLALFIYYLAHRGNFRLGAMKAWLLGVMAAWMLILTFAIAAPLRSYLKTERGYGQQVAAVMVAGARAAINPRSLMLLGGLVSKRISGGFDGLVAVNQEQPEIVKDAFSLRRTVLIVLAKLIPRYGVEEEMVTGKAIAVAYGGVSLDQRQASAVGLFAALQLMFGPRLSYVAALGLGLLWAGYFRVTERFRDPDVTFLFHFIGMQQLIIWVMSGNFDIVIPGTIRSLVYLVVYGGLVVVTATVARGRGDGLMPFRHGPNPAAFRQPSMPLESLRMLVVTESVPFPPRNGRELPTCHLVRGFAERFVVDLLVASGERADFERRRACVPGSVRGVTWIGTRQASALRRAAGEVIGLRPSYFARGFSAAKLKRAITGGYDFIWISPVGLLGLLYACRRFGLLRRARVGIGLNDVKATLYADSVRASLAGRGRLHDLLRGPRLLGLRAAERRYLRECDLVHVQTELELDRARALLGPGVGPLLVQAQNGRKQELFDVSPAGPESRDILYMTHLSGGRARESRWFLEEVWPTICQKHPGTILHIVGSPPERPQIERAFRQRLSGEVRIHGFVEDLVGLFGSMRVAVVPILHSTGIINRIIDALTAGLPVVSTPGPLGTVSGLEPGRHALAAQTPDEFSDAVSSLLTDPRLWTRLSTEGRALAREQPSWTETVGRVADAVVSCSAQSGGRNTV